MPRAVDGTVRRSWRGAGVDAFFVEASRRFGATASRSASSASASRSPVSSGCFLVPLRRLHGGDEGGGARPGGGLRQGILDVSPWLLAGTRCQRKVSLASLSLTARELGSGVALPGLSSGREVFGCSAAALGGHSAPEKGVSGLALADGV